MRLRIQGSGFLSPGGLEGAGRRRPERTVWAAQGWQEWLPLGWGSSLGLWDLCVCPQLTEGKMMERRKKIALELSELVVYCRPVPFDEESKDQGPARWVCVWVPSMAGAREVCVPECGVWGAGPQHCLGRSAL